MLLLKMETIVYYVAQKHKSVFDLNNCHSNLTTFVSGTPKQLQLYIRYKTNMDSVMREMN
jgi:5'-3' exonuclease